MPFRSYETTQRWRPGSPVYLVRDGKVARAEVYADRAEALEAVGLPA